MENNQPIQQPNTKSEYELNRQKKIDEQRRTQRNRMIKRISKITLVVLLVGGSVGWLVWFISTQSKLGEIADITKQCVQHGRVGMHIHPVLHIVINGKNEAISANIGIPSPSCMRPLHTHDSSGTIHIESKKIRDFRLKEFFAVWGKPFSREQILDYKIDEKHSIRVTINDVESNEFENLIMKDGDKIEIRYK